MQFNDLRRAIGKRANGYGNGRALGAMLACAILSFGCDRLRPEAPAGPGAQEPTGRSEPAKLLQVQMETTVSGGAEPLIHGTTNLPDGTILFAQLRPRYPECYPTCQPSNPVGSGDAMAGGRVVVRAGGFNLGPLWQNHWPRPDGASLLHSGTYILEIKMMQEWGSEAQPPSVRAITGRKNENLTGPLLGGCCMGDLPTEKTRYEQSVADASSFFGPDLYYARYVELPSSLSEPVRNVTTDE